jgi:DNA-binding LytR/AlgR family response regulator
MDENQPMDPPDGGAVIPEVPPAARPEGRADRRALLLIGAMLLASLVVEGVTQRSEAARVGSPVTWQETWLSEATSHLAILLLAPLLPLLLDRFPLPGESWLRSGSAHVAGAVAFSAAHVGAMFMARVLAFPAVVGFAYRPNLFAPAHFVYELRKDVLTYAMLLVAFVLLRSVEQRREDAQAALQQARRDHRLTLRSGSATFVLDAEAVLWARAAANYVEVATAGRTYLARITLKRLEELLRAAGDRHVRVHRSHLVNAAEIREVVPTGEGDLRLTLSDGSVTPGSRRYRDRLLAAIEAAPTARDA